MQHCLDCKYSKKENKIKMDKNPCFFCRWSLPEKSNFTPTNDYIARLSKEAEIEDVLKSYESETNFDAPDLTCLSRLEEWLILELLKKGEKNGTI